MHMESATLASALFLFEIRNEHAVRSMSLNQKEITFEEHQRWLQATLSSQDSKIYIGREKQDGERIGYVRGKKISDDLWELSWAVHGSFRGKGFSHSLLREGLTKFHGSILARIKENNEASKKIAKNNQFKRLGAFDQIEFWFKLQSELVLPLKLDHFGDLWIVDSEAEPILVREGLVVESV